MKPVPTVSAAPARSRQAGSARSFPARSLLGAGLPARLVLVAAALVLLWLTILWALG